jgi:hypothetical protein
VNADAKLMIGMGCMAALVCGWLLGDKQDTKAKKARETMAKLIEELEILANNVRDPVEMQRVTMRATVLGTKLLGEVLEAVQDGAKKTATATSRVSSSIDALALNANDNELHKLVRNIQRIADKVDPPPHAAGQAEPGADPWVIPHVDSLPAGLVNPQLVWSWDPWADGNGGRWVIHSKGYSYDVFIHRSGDAEGNLNEEAALVDLVRRRDAAEPNGPVVRDWEHELSILAPGWSWRSQAPNCWATNGKLDVLSSGALDRGDPGMVPSSVPRLVRERNHQERSAP